MSAALPPQVGTPRLLLRQWRPADREPFSVLNADPEVAEHLGGPLDRAASDALADRLEAAWEADGHGLYTAQALSAGPWGAAGTMLVLALPRPSGRGPAAR